MRFHVALLTLAFLVPPAQTLAEPRRAVAAKTDSARGPETEPASRAPAIAAALAREDLDEAARLGRAGAEAGDPDAQFLLGYFHDLGLGVELSLEDGTSWQEKAAGQGHVWSRLYLAWKWRNGIGVKTADVPRAIELQGDLLQRELPARPLDFDWLGVNGRNFTPRFDRAALLLRRRAERGDARSAFNFALYQILGLTGRPNAEAHVAWLRRAAELGSASAAARLDLYYGTGLFVTADKAEAARWELRAAELGDASAQHALGRARQRAGDLVAARHWFKRAAAQDHVPSLNRLADLLRKSASTDREADLAEALRLSQRAVELGDAEAFADLAGMHRRGEATAPDPTKAFDLYRQSGERGYAYGAMMVGWMLSRGEVGAPDHVSARTWFERAAAGENADAMRELGQIYLHGRGLPSNKEQAFIWLERAAREGDAWSQVQIGQMLRSGTGVEADEEEAVTWFKLAVESGSGLGHGNLGYHYAHGRGVAKDLALAFEHLTQALRTSADAGTVGTFGGLFDGENGSSPVLLARLKDLIRERSLMEIEGPLPETCVHIALAVFRGEDRKLAEELLMRYSNSRRRSVPGTMAVLTFYGLGVPFDLARAREYARAATATDILQSRAVIALIESVAAESLDERRQHRAELFTLARSGNVIAQRALRLRQADEWTAADFRRAQLPGLDRLAALESALGQRSSDAPPQVLFALQPKYPAELRASELVGEAVLDFVVDETGAVSSIELVSASHPLFGRNAFDVIARWRFAPALAGGQKVARRVRQTIGFNLLDTP